MTSLQALQAKREYLKKCTRIGGCLMKVGIECSCEILRKLDADQTRRDNVTSRKKHLSDVAFVNQNGRGK